MKNQIIKDIPLILPLLCLNNQIISIFIGGLHSSTKVKKGLQTIEKVRKTLKRKLEKDIEEEIPSPAKEMKLDSKLNRYMIVDRI